MIQSMTGYGKAVATLQGGNLTVEIRTLNGKNAEVNLRTSLIPKDKELALRKKIADSLVRGTIDVYLTWEPNEGTSQVAVSGEILRSYYTQVADAFGGAVPEADPAIIAAVLRLPDVTDARKQEIITAENWPLVDAAFDECLAAVRQYRFHEGEALYADVTSRVRTILSIYDEVEAFEGERIAAVRERILKAAEELSVKMEGERFEQEMILYLEKLDINEEKVRLRQHCKYFMDTIDGESEPGKKLGFIIQEMGREINTTGSKASHAGIQKCVVRMKDELEKIREQSMNIL